MASPKAKAPKVSKVSPSSLDNKLAPKVEVEVEMTADGLPADSDEAKQLQFQRQFLAEVAKPAFIHAKDARRKYDQEWIARNLFWRGYQFSRYLPQTQTVVLSSRQNARIPINLIAAHMRAIRNQVTSFRPKIELMPANPSSKASKTQTRYEQRLADYYWDKLKLKQKVKETITQGLLYSVGGPWQIIYDDLKQDVRIKMWDTFDFFIDPLAEEFNDESPEYCIGAGRIAMPDITHNSKFNLFARKEVVAGDMQLAASEYKQFMIQAIRQVSPRINQDSPTLILKDGHFKRRHDDGSIYMVHLMWTDSNATPLFYEELETDEFDYVLYKADLNPKEIYGESWIKHVMAINRVINSLESSAFEYNYRVAKGRIVIDKDSGIKQISNVHGEIISANRGARIESLDMAPLPVAVPQQIERMWRYMEDVSGIHEASLGRLPSGVKSGVGVAELKQSDATSQDDLVDNLEDFLEEVFRKLFKKIAMNLTSHKIIKALGVREDEAQYFAVIGENAAKNKKQNQIPGHEGQIKIGVDWFDIAEIKEDNLVRVFVGTWLGYTKEAMQQKVTQWYQLQLIDQATALQLMEFGDVDEIVQKTRVEALLKKPAQMGPDGQPQVDQYSLATSENGMFLDGTVTSADDAVRMVSETDDHMVHIAVHQEALDQGFDPVVGAHIDAHQHYLGVSHPTGNGIDIKDQARAQVTSQQGGGQANQSASTPSSQSQPGMPSAPAPMGLPGQNLPQQNPATSMQNNLQAATSALGGQGGS